MIKIADIPDFNLREEQAAALERAIGTERAAASFRRKGEIPAAIDAYDRAGTAYADTGLSYHGQGESELAREVYAAIRRCQHIASNLRHPKEKRPAARTPRPDCLGCGKPLRRYKNDGRTYSDGTPREWGDYGDNRFCGLKCGWFWACRNAPMPIGCEIARIESYESKQKGSKP